MESLGNLEVYDFAVKNNRYVCSAIDIWKEKIFLYKIQGKYL